MNDKSIDFSKVQDCKPMTSNRKLAMDIATAWETFSKEQLEACQGWLQEALKNESNTREDFSKDGIVTEYRHLARSIAIGLGFISKDEIGSVIDWIKKDLDYVDPSAIPLHKIQAYRNCLQGAENLMGKMLTVIAACRDAITYRDFVIAFQCWQEEKDGL